MKEQVKCKLRTTAYLYWYEPEKIRRFGSREAVGEAEGNGSGSNVHFVNRCWLLIMRAKRQSRAGEAQCEPKE